MSIKLEEFKSEKIILMDFSGLRDQDYLDEIEKAE